MARASGLVQRYALPMLVREQSFMAGCRAQQMALNCDSTRSVLGERVDFSRSLVLTTRPLDFGGPRRDESRRLIIVDVQGVLSLWSVDEAELADAAAGAAGGVAAGGPSAGVFGVGMRAGEEGAAARKLELQRKVGGAGRNAALPHALRRACPLLPTPAQDVWDVLWAEDSPSMFATMEKTRMVLFRDATPEEPIVRCVSCRLGCHAVVIAAVCVGSSPLS